MRLGVFGGAFDPPHFGHQRIAEAAVAQLSLDQVIFVPNGVSPLKGETIQASAEDRLEMTKLLIQKHENFALTDIETKQTAVSYTVDTMAELTIAKPGDYWFIVGSDAMKGISDWKDWKRLAKLCRFAVAFRGQDTPDRIRISIPEDVRSKIDFLDLKPLRISSTMLKQHLANGFDISPWTPGSVMDYIRSNGLYAR